MPRKYIKAIFHYNCSRSPISQINEVIFLRKPNQTVSAVVEANMFSLLPLVGIYSTNGDGCLGYRDIRILAPVSWEIPLCNFGNMGVSRKMSIADTFWFWFCWCMSRVSQHILTPHPSNTSAGSPLAPIGWYLFKRGLGQPSERS